MDEDEIELRLSHKFVCLVPDAKVTDDELHKVIARHSADVL